MVKDIQLFWVESVGAPVVGPASWEKPSVDPAVAEVVKRSQEQPRRLMVASEVGVMHQGLVTHSPSDASEA